jgi:hypothetical protein
MSTMTDLDITLSEYKLSDAQKNAVLEVIETSFPVNAKKNTLASLLKKGLVELIEGTEDNYTLSEDFARELGVGATPEITQTEEEIQADQKYFDDEFFDVFGKHNLMGQWRNSEVWADMSLEEIKEDIKTARPINRKTRRLHTRLLASEYRKMYCPRPRKALKLTGAKGM